MATLTDSLQLTVAIFTTLGLIAFAVLSFFTFQQTRLLNQFLKTPLAIVLNLLTLLFFLTTLATLGLAILIFIGEAKVAF